MLSCADFGADERRVRLFPNFVKRTGGRFLPLSVAGALRTGRPRPNREFFVMVLGGNLLQRADPNRGRFRSLVLKALQNFLIDEKAKKRARKRGGDIQFVSWDD